MSEQGRVLDFEHYKKTGKLKYSTPAPHPEDHAVFDEALKAYQSVLEMSTDEILLEVQNRLQTLTSGSLHEDLSIPILIDELGYRSMVIDSILLSAVKKCNKPE